MLSLLKQIGPGNWVKLEKDKNHFYVSVKSEPGSYPWKKEKKWKTHKNKHLD